MPTKNSKRELTSAYSFKAKLWKHDGPSGWFFVSVPIATSKRIRQSHLSSEEGWGRLKTKATIGRTSWNTAVWFDSNRGRYLLPVKKTIRDKEAVKPNQMLSVALEFERILWEIDLITKYGSERRT